MCWRVGSRVLVGDARVYVEITFISEVKCRCNINDAGVYRYKTEVLVGDVLYEY